MANSVSMSNSTSLCVKLSHRYQILPGNPVLSLAIISKYKASWCFSNRQNFLPDQIITNQRMQKENTTKRNLLVVYSTVQPGVPLPPEPPSGSWKSWVMAILFAVVLPFLGNKWGPLLKIKNIETAVETAEHIVDEVEKVAEKVEKVTEDIANELPEGGKLRNTVAFVEKVAKEADKDAHLAEDLMTKVEEVEQMMESSVESPIDEIKEPDKTQETKGVN